MKKNIVFILLLLFTAKYFAQEITFNQVKEQYEAFEYEKVIQLSNSLIKQSGITDSLKIEIYQMRVVSFYSLGDEISTQNSFREILRINKNYQPDPSKISPRLIAIFQVVKDDFLKSIKQETSSKDTLIQAQQEVSSIQLKNSFLKNLFVPGWGQLSSGYSEKGYLLSIVSSANLISMFYFIFDSKKKETDYLKEIDKNLIPSKYDSYNKSYKLRNIFITSYVIIWIYSQIDLLLFSEGIETNFQQNDGITFYNNSADFKVNFRLPISF